LLPFGGFFVRGLPTLALHGRNSDSAGNYQLIDVESTVSMGFPPGVTSSGTRNPPEGGRGFHRELPAYCLGFRPERSKFAENPSSGNNSKINSSKSYILTIPTFLKI
jgi:hypothetical protein